MAQSGVSLTKLYGNRSGSAGSILLLFLQKTLLIFFAVMRLVPLFIVLSAGSALQARGQTTAYVSSSAPLEPDLPDAPLPSPTPQQSAQASNARTINPRHLTIRKESQDA
jgi:hypothetical protein